MPIVLIAALVIATLLFIRVAVEIGKWCAFRWLMILGSFLAGTSAVSELIALCR